MRIRNNHAGFEVIEIVIVVVVIAVLGFGGWAVISKHKTKAPTNTNSKQTTTTSTKSSSTTTNSSTADELTAVAKQIYYQVAADGTNPPTVGSCASQQANYAGCPLTSDLIAKLSNPPGAGPGDGGTLIAGAQNGPFGTLTYSAAPSGEGGTVAVHLSPDTAVSNEEENWNLTISNDGSKLLVNDIQFSRTAYGGNPACGPIEVYDYTSCPMSPSSH